MIHSLSRLAMAAGAATLRRPSEILAQLRRDGIDGLAGIAEDFSTEEASTAERLAEDLASRGFDVLVHGEMPYPASLDDLRNPPPFLFFAGALELLDRDGVGMCGSRRASEAGLRAARACGLAVSHAGLVVISGNAKGVDAEAHAAALDAGGATILVLAEGPLQYRPKRSVAARSDENQMLVLTQFAPRLPWHVGNAMARNGVIAALGEALVVIEAGEQGGTLDAGLQGLRIGRPVVALEFESAATPPGNAILHSKGAIAVRRPGELTAVLSQLAERGSQHPQLELPITSHG